MEKPTSTEEPGQELWQLLFPCLIFWALQHIRWSGNRHFFSWTDPNSETLERVHRYCLMAGTREQETGNCECLGLSGWTKSRVSMYSALQRKIGIVTVYLWSNPFAYLQSPVPQAQESSCRRWFRLHRCRSGSARTQPTSPLLLSFPYLLHLQSVCTISSLSASLLVSSFMQTQKSPENS